MAKRRKKRIKEQKMGRILVAGGLFCKIIQIIGAALAAEALTGTVMTLVTTCLLAGGLAVMAIERMNVSASFALLSVVGIIGGVLPSNGYVYSFIFLAVSLAAYGAMLISMKKRARAACGVVVIILTVLLSLHSFGVLAIPTPLITLILSAAYAVMGVGLFL